jgi:cytochrome P450
MPDLVDLFGGHFMSEVPNPYPVYATLRREAPVKYVDLPMAPGYMVTRYADVMAVLKDGVRYSSRANAKGIGLVMGRTILEMDGKEHARHRHIISPVFVPKALLRDLPPIIAAIAHELIDGFVGDGRADLVSQFAHTLPLRVIAHIIGVPIEEYETFQRWSLDIIGFADDPPRGLEAAAKLVEYLRPIVERRKAEPDEDLLSTLTHTEVEGHRLTDEEIYSFLRLLLPAGSDTTYRLISNMLFALLHDVAQLDAVRSDRSLVKWAVEEALRWEAPVQFAAREATEPTTLAGIDLPAGAQVLTALGSANRDERQYDDPDRFDIRRGRDDHMAFGFGQHFCVGSHLARLEAATAFNALFDRLRNLRVEPGQNDGVVGLAFRGPNRLPVLFDA